MKIMSTFGSFTTARLGIYAAQQGLNVTGHNITNINTNGYTRQNLDQMALRTGAPDRFGSEFNALPGSGVILTGISQIRDPYLDIRFRNEQASVGQTDAKLAGLEDIARVLDEITRGDGSGVLEKQFNDMLTQLEGLSTRVGQEEFDTLVRSSAANLVSLLNNYSNKLDTVYENTMTGFNQDIDRVNYLLGSIGKLNESILKSDIHGDPGLELRDQRNLYIDELSQYMKIDVRYETIGIGAGYTAEKLVISLGGTTNGDPEKSKSTLIDGNFYTQLSKTQMYDVTKDPPKWIPALDENNDPILDENNDPVLVIDPENPGTIIDKNLQLTLSALKDSKGRTHDTLNKAVELGDNDLYGSLQGTREILTEAGEFTDKSIIEGTTIPDFSVPGNIPVEDMPTIDVPPVDLNAGTKRGIPYYKSALDSLAKQFADVLNRANTGYLYNSDGAYVDSMGVPVAQYDDGGGGQPITLTKDTELTDDMITWLEDKGAIKLGGPLFSSSASGNNTDDITAANISISRDWANGDVRIVNSFAMGNGVWSATNPARPGNTDTSNIEHIIVEFQGAQNYYSEDVNPDAYDGDVAFFKGSFQEMLTNINVTLATDINSTTALLTNYVTTATELNTSRDNIMGVDLNDEAVNLMQYQKSYSAACRLMTTLDEALERLINNTGVVGR